jgi:diguanylate cyclase (GGDEF)-like protein/PAS domain S-box-containing protein
MTSPVVKVQAAPAGRVLVVDDDPICLKAIAGMLRQAGLAVQTAGTGASALELLRESLPDLVLLDLLMPDVSGFEVLTIIRESWDNSQLPVIMVTAESGRESIVRAFRAGANDYLTKPLDQELALARVELQLRLRRAQSELVLSRQRYAMAAHGARIGLWDWDVPSNQIFFSARWKEMLGYADHELESTVDAWFSRIHPDDHETFVELLHCQGTLEQGRFESEIRLRHRDASYRWMLCSGAVEADETGYVRRLAGSLSDITDGKVRDVLTGLPNRLLFEEQLGRVMKEQHDRKRLSAVLFLDLDNFKLVNDSLGHAAGDLLLCSVARRLESCLRGSDVVSRERAGWSIARHGGDEFTVLLHSLQSRRDAEQIAQRLIAALAEPLQIGGREVAVGVSIGIAFGEGEGKTPADAVREADTAMYHAKTAGRGRFRIFDPEMQSVASARLALESDLRQAVKGEQFFLLYQPIVRIASGRIEGMEALCRWRHPRGELIGPDVFVPVLESLGLIGRLGRLVTELACQDVMDWNEQGRVKPGIAVTINCSSREFVQPHFKNDLLLSIARSGVDPRLLKVEVTESTLMENPDQVRGIIRDLRELGIRIGIDDFGTGYSSLAYLHRLPLDLLKIDQSFIKTMLTCSETREIVRTIISLGQNLELDIVAEGVETEDQQRLLYDMGCTHAQGYLYSPPIEASDIPRMLREHVRPGGIVRPAPSVSSPVAELQARLDRVDALLRSP